MLLFAAAPVQVNAGGFNALVAENVGEEGDVVALFDEVFCEQVPEGMGMNDGGIESVAKGGGL